MSFTVRSLILHREIVPPKAGTPGDGTVAILPYRSLVAKGNLEPDPKEHLVRLEDDGTAGKTSIRAGRYLFAQGLSSPGESAATDPARAEAEGDWRAATEAVWLESLWRDIAFADDRVFVRILTEDGKTVFQIFRELAAEE